MTKTGCVYSLSDPSGEIRYVGVTICGANTRFSGHLASAKSGKTKRDVWIRELVGSGSKPVLGILEDEVPVEKLSSREVFHISDQRGKGAQLTNSTNGGYGVAPTAPTAPTSPKEALFRNLRGVALRARRAKDLYGRDYEYYKENPRWALNTGQRGALANQEECIPMIAHFVALMSERDVDSVLSDYTSQALLNQGIDSDIADVIRLDAKLFVEYGRWGDMYRMMRDIYRIPKSAVDLILSGEIFPFCEDRFPLIRVAEGSVYVGVKVWAHSLGMAPVSGVVIEEGGLNAKWGWTVKLDDDKLLWVRDGVRMGSNRIHRDEDRLYKIKEAA